MRGCDICGGKAIMREQHRDVRDTSGGELGTWRVRYSCKEHVNSVEVRPYQSAAASSDTGQTKG
jgi:hypothetical protein